MGPGFDSLGLALSLYNTMTFRKTEGGLSISGCPEEFRNEEHLAVKAYRAVLRRLGLPVEEGLSLTMESEIPISRGLGSSAAMLAGGVVAANLLHGAPLSKEELLAIANVLEGHPDNLAPALYGGLTASLTEEGRPMTVRLPLSPNLRFVAVIPDFPLSTHEARAVLPKTVPFADAVFNASHAAVLLGALGEGDPALIRAALQDKLHQPYRRSLIPGYDAVEAAAKGAGAIAFMVSGAGPTLMALTDDPHFAVGFEAALGGLRAHWQVLPLAVDTEGVTVISGQ